MSYSCLHCPEHLDEDLFIDELVEVTGLEDSIPDLLWAAKKSDLVGTRPSAVYFYTWQEVNLKEVDKRQIIRSDRPFVDLGRGGLYVGTKRAINDFDVYKYIEACENIAA